MLSRILGKWDIDKITRNTPVYILIKLMFNLMHVLGSKGRELNLELVVSQALFKDTVFILTARHLSYLGSPFVDALTKV